MDFMKLAAQRYSVRQFSDRPVEPEVVRSILEAGRIAPTAANFQPQRILVLQKPESLAKLEACMPYRFGQTLAILVCYDNTVSWKRRNDGEDSGAVDASIVATHMMLQAANLGIGSTWVGNFGPQALRSTFALPESFVPVALLLMGYPAESAKPNPNHTARLPLESTVYYEGFAASQKE